MANKTRRTTDPRQARVVVLLTDKEKRATHRAAGESMQGIGEWIREAMQFRLENPQHFKEK